MADLTLIRNELKSKGYESTLRELSWSRKKGSQEQVTFCNSDFPAFNFDQFKKDTCKKLGQSEKKSFDALVLGKHRIYCVEFKNEKEVDVDNQIIRGKYKDGIELLSKLFETHRVDPLQYEFSYFVVFRDYSKITSYRKKDRENSVFNERKEDENVKFGLAQERDELLKSKLPEAQEKIHKRITINTRQKMEFIKLTVKDLKRGILCFDSR